MCVIVVQPAGFELGPYWCYVCLLCCCCCFFFLFFFAILFSTKALLHLSRVAVIRWPNLAHLTLSTTHAVEIPIRIFFLGNQEFNIVVVENSVSNIHHQHEWSLIRLSMWTPYDNTQSYRQYQIHFLCGSIEPKITRTHKIFCNHNHCLRRFVNKHRFSFLWLTVPEVAIFLYAFAGVCCYLLVIYGLVPVTYLFSYYVHNLRTGAKHTDMDVMKKT